MNAQNERTRERLDTLTNGDPHPSRSDLEERELPSADDVREQMADEAGECPFCGHEASETDVQPVRCEEIGEKRRMLRCRGDACTNVYEPEFGWRFDADGGTDPRE